MAKAVFRPGEVVLTEERVLLDAPQGFGPAWFQPQAEEKPEPDPAEDVYLGPTAEDLRREADEFRARWEEEKAAMIAGAEEEARRILKEAEDAAFKEVKRKTGEAQEEKRRAEDEAERIIAEAEEKAASLEADAQAEFDERRRDAEKEGRDAGHEEGFAEGRAEAERLVKRTQVILERAQSKRAEILAETEQQLVDLVLLIARKVVKSISDSQREVVIQNVVQALRKVRSRGNIIIRVNMADLKLTTEHTAEFIRMMEGVSGIQVSEDSSVDPGGCIIETDFGEIDARISSQLAELEARILELSPLKGRAKGTAAARRPVNGAPAANGAGARPQGNGNAPGGA
ncbi:MAG: flagellar assembly protein FliH [Spirochaetaceae bacterium]|jgi:flagellar assembly protein FliH|nr:flagellar assembly protein FliH [Spirochaetaceae bacterium]